MITIIIFGIIGFIIGFRSWYKDFGHDAECYWFGFIGAMLSSMLGFGISVALPTQTIKGEPNIKELVSLQDGQSINGSFFLGCGSIDGKMKYTYYYEIEKDIFKMGQVSYNRALIKYDSTAYLETYTYEQTDVWYNWFSISLGQLRKQYIFHVPEGTIKNNYNLDAN